MQRRKFSRELKIEAVKLVKERDVGGAGRPDRGIHVNELSKWVKQFGSDLCRLSPARANEA